MGQVRTRLRSDPHRGLDRAGGSALTRGRANHLERHRDPVAETRRPESPRVRRQHRDLRVTADSPKPRTLGVVVCGAAPASDVAQLIETAQREGWSVFVIATPSAVPFIDVEAVESLIGMPLRTRY